MKIDVNSKTQFWRDTPLTVTAFVSGEGSTRGGVSWILCSVIQMHLLKTKALHPFARNVSC